MPNETEKEISDLSRKLMQDAVREVLQGDKNHGWGQEDSLEAIELIIMADSETFAKAGSVAKNYTLSSDALDAVSFFINPSACRQRLEGWKILNASGSSRKSKFAKFDI